MSEHFRALCCVHISNFNSYTLLNIQKFANTAGNICNNGNVYIFWNDTIKLFKTKCVSICNEFSLGGLSWHTIMVVKVFLYLSNEPFYWSAQVISAICMTQLVNEP